MGYFNIRAVIRTDKQRRDGKCPIYLVVSINGKIIKIPVGVNGVSKEWDNTAGLFSEQASSIRNTILKKKIAAIEEFLWQQVAAGNEISTDLVKIQFGKGKNKGFYALLEQCYESKLRILAPATKRHYLLVKRRLLEFREDMPLTKINQDFLIDFENFLRSKAIGDGGIGTHHKVLKVILNYGIKKKVIRENPYAYFKVKRESPHHIPLSEEQIKAIQSVAIKMGPNKLNKGLDLTRDLFLFSCYTALRFSDVLSLTEKQLVSSYLELKQSKTGLVVQIPLLERAIDIVKKYISEDRETIFPPLSNQTANRHLKRIAKLCGIDINIHFHLSRHSFGYIMAGRGMNAFALSKVMGHSSIKTTMLYVNQNLAAVREQMKQSAIFK